MISLLFRICFTDMEIARAGTQVGGAKERVIARGRAFYKLTRAGLLPVGGGFETVGRTEEIVGRWLEGRRHDFVVATKCGGAMSARRWDRGASLCVTGGRVERGDARRSGGRSC